MSPRAPRQHQIKKLRADRMLEVPRCPVCPKINSAMYFALERKFERELNDAGIVHSLVNLVEMRPDIYILHMGIAAAVEKKLGVIPGVEEFSAEVQPHAFVGKREMLDEREIRVYKVRAI